MAENACHCIMGFDGPIFQKCSVFLGRPFYLVQSDSCIRQLFQCGNVNLGICRSCLTTAHNSRALVAINRRSNGCTAHEYAPPSLMSIVTKPMSTIPLHLRLPYFVHA